MKRVVTGQLSKALAVAWVALLFLMSSPLMLASANAIKLAVNPNVAKVKQKITLTASVTSKGKAATGGTVTFFDGKTPLAMINTIPIQRTREAAKDGEVVTFKEAPAAAPRAIDAWFYDETVGCEMID